MPVDDTWNGGPENLWNEASFNLAENTPVFVLGRKFFAADQGTQFVRRTAITEEASGYVDDDYVDDDYVENYGLGEFIYSYIPVATRLERIGLPVLKEGISVARVIELIRGVYPVFEGTEEVVVNISIGVQQAAKNPITWEGPYPFEIGADFFADFFSSGRYISIKFETTELADWKLQGFEVDARTLGER